MASDFVYAGIDIGGTNIKFGLFDSSGKILHREQRQTLAEKGPLPLMHLVTNIAERLLFFAADEDLTVKHLGVGTPGAVDFASGRVIGPCPNIPGWQGMDIGRNLKDRLNMPVFVDNDANAMALAECRFGSAAGAKTVLCATVGTGVGGGLVFDGHIWRGAHSAAGELGHMPINFDGPKCGCGQNGCLEAYCSSKAIMTRLQKKLGQGLTPAFEKLLDGPDDKLTVKKLFAAQAKGDEVAIEVIEETARYLAIGLAGVVNLLNPDTVVIGGGVADGGGGFVEIVASEIRKRAFASAVEELRVVRAGLGNNAGFVGAGLLGDDTI
ncbi:MAG: ROK family protein [bacterium]